MSKEKVLEKVPDAYSVECNIQTAIEDPWDGKWLVYDGATIIEVIGRGSTEELAWKDTLDQLRKAEEAKRFRADCAPEEAVKALVKIRAECDGMDGAGLFEAVCILISQRDNSYNEAEPGKFTEKEHRIYYQDIVYGVCALVESISKEGEPIIQCGTINSPSTEVQDRLRELLRPS